MRITTEPGLGDGLFITAEELKVLRQPLSRMAQQLDRKCEKYRDIQESGEATTRQQNTLAEVEEQLAVAERLVDNVMAFFTLYNTNDDE